MKNKRPLKPRRYRPDTVIYSRLIITLGAIVGFIVLILFFGVAILANVDIFWRILSPNRGTSTILKDSTAPSPPYIQTSETAVKIPYVNIIGFTEAGVAVKIFINHQEIEANLANDAGEFDFERLELKEGENDIYVKATDISKNESQPSNTLRITYDKTPPEITITSPQGGEIKSENRYHEIKGSTEPGSRVTINGHYALTDIEGNFALTFKFEDGQNSIKVKVIDRAGNETEQILQVRFEKED